MKVDVFTVSDLRDLRPYMNEGAVCIKCRALDYYHDGSPRYAGSRNAPCFSCGHHDIMVQAYHKRLDGQGAAVGVIASSIVEPADTIFPDSAPDDASSTCSAQPGNRGRAA